MGGDGMEVLWGRVGETGWDGRVTTHLKDLEKLGNSKVSGKSQGKWKKSWKVG